VIRKNARNCFFFPYKTSSRYANIDHSRLDSDIALSQYVSEPERLRHLPSPIAPSTRDRRRDRLHERISPAGSRSAIPLGKLRVTPAKRLNFTKKGAHSVIPSVALISGELE